MRILRAIGLSGVLVSASLTAAQAADLYVKAAPPVAIEAYNWNGWYGGVGVGYLSGDSAWTYTNGAAVTPGFDYGVAGVFGGYQYQLGNLGLGNLVVGAEYSANFALDNFGGGTACPNAAFTCQAHLNYYVTTGARVGLAFGNFLIYGTGGWAGGELDTRGVTVATGVVVEPTTSWHNGWYAGAGLDWVMYRDRRFSWILGVDYKHIELDTKYHSSPPGTLIAGVSRFADVQVDVVQARLTVKMDGPGWFLN